jgi:AIPR protein
MYSAHGQALIERNVRSFLQLKNKINASMLETIEKKPVMFLPFNNGLAITATGIKTKKLENGQQSIVELTNPQIVNGGQTTAVLFEAANSKNLPLADVMVQAKLTIVNDPVEADRLTPLISKYSNSQTAVKKTDFDSKDKFHTDLFDVAYNTPFRDPDGKWVYYYYESKAGQYDQELNLLAAEAREERESFYPRHLKITKLELATFFSAWNQFPFQAARGEGINFAFFQDYKETEKLLANTAAWKEYVGMANLYRGVDYLVGTLGLGAYKKMTVAYTVAVMSDRRAKKIQWEALTNEGLLPSALTEEIRQLAPQVRNLIIQAAGSRNILSYAKSLECWSQLKMQRDLKVGIALVSPTIVKDVSIDKYLVSAQLLTDLESWSVENKVGDGKQRLACRTLKENLRRRKLTHPKTSQAVVDLLELCWKNGMPKIRFVSE